MMRFSKPLKAHFVVSFFASKEVIVVDHPQNRPGAIELSTLPGKESLGSVGNCLGPMSGLDEGQHWFVWGSCQFPWGIGKTS